MASSSSSSPPSSSLLLNPVLASLDVRPTDRIISIKECHGGNNCDSNFILTHLIKHSLVGGGLKNGAKDCRLCLVTLHNNLAHYENVSKKLGYDLHKFIENGSVKVIEILKDIVDEIDLSCEDLTDLGSKESGRFFNDNKESVVRLLFSRIRQSVEELAANRQKDVCLIIDDLSHLGDLGIGINLILSFVNYCLSLLTTQTVDHKIDNQTSGLVGRIVINNHVCGKSDEIVSNYLNYVSDVNVEVSPLKTGLSSEVTGLMVVERRRTTTTTTQSDGGVQSLQKESSLGRRYHFKAYDKGIKTFHLGESVYNLYK